VELLVKNKSGLGVEASTYINLILLFLLSGSLIFSLNYEFVTPPIKTVLTQAAVISLGLLVAVLFLFNVLKSTLIQITLLSFLYFIFFSFLSSNLSFFVTVLSLNIFLSFIVLPRAQAFFLSSFCFFLLTLNLLMSDAMWSDYSPYQYLVNFLTFIVYAVGGLYIKSSLSENNDLVGLLSLRLKSESDLNKTIVDSLTSGVLICDHKNNFKALNEKARIIIKDHPKLLKNIIQNLEKESGSFEFESNKSFFRLHYSKMSDIEKSDYVILASDDTDYRNEQKELENTKKLAAIGTLSAGLAHEIRNPLAGMSGSAELLKEGGNDDETNKKLFNSLLKEIDRLNLLVTDFLSFSLPSVQLSDKINFKVFLANLIEEVKLNPKVKGVVIDNNFDDFFIKVDESKLKQVFLNIILNAVEAFDNDHIVKLEKRDIKPEIFISGKSSGHKYSVEVVDNGSGISEFDLEKIFEPFHTTKDKGTGLGLALSHRILKEHGALVQVESDLGTGTKFKIEFKN